MSQTIEATGATGKKSVFEGTDPQVRVRTKKMLMYFIIFAIVMLFAGFTSAYIVSNMGEYWVHINPPMSLWYSNAIILVSSVSMISALRAMKRGNKQLTMIMLAITLALGVAFTFTQQAAWKELRSKGMGWTINTTEAGLKAYSWNNISEITGEYGTDYYVHKDGSKLAMHEGQFYAANDPTFAVPLTGKVTNMNNNSGAFIWVLIIIHIMHLVFGLIYLTVNLIRTSKGIINQHDTVRLETNGIYWHFLGILWVYLFAFLFLIH
jgi:heme/copper-type cytochrome/quinol oxidase subunit 3